MKMGKILTPLLFILSALLLLVRMPAGETAQLNRDLLWVTVQICVAAKKTTGIALPCLNVDLGSGDRPGTALLHVPGTRTHLVLMPTEDISGLESPRLLASGGASLFKAAVDARSRLVAASGGQLHLSDLGVAINSSRARSQDHLHLHVDCVGAPIRAALDRFGPAPDTWTWLPGRVEERRYLVRKIGPEEIGTFNPFAALRGYLPRPEIILQSSLALIPARSETQDGFYLLADVRPNSYAEILLDHTCAAAATNTASSRVTRDQP